VAGQWRIDILPPAQLDLDQLADDRGDDAYGDVLQDILDLQENPLPPGHLHLRGTRRRNDLGCDAPVAGPVRFQLPRTGHNRAKVTTATEGFSVATRGAEMTAAQWLGY
jgi:hypothetical protein